MTSVRRRCADARYELRVWGDLDHLAERLRARGTVGAEETVTDTYVVGPLPDANVKIRDGEIDVKRRLGERDGFQRWCPTWKQAAPFELAHIARLSGELGVDPPSALAHLPVPVTATTLIDLVDGHADLRAIRVTKHRCPVTLGDVDGEITVVRRPDGQQIGSVAIEGQDVGALAHARAALGLADAVDRPVHVAVGADWRELRSRRVGPPPDAGA